MIVRCGRWAVLVRNVDRQMGCAYSPYICIFYFGVTIGRTITIIIVQYSFKLPLSISVLNMQSFSFAFRHAFVYFIFFCGGQKGRYMLIFSIFPLTAHIITVCTYIHT